VDIVVALDVSGSMRAEDFRPRNRLTVAKEVFLRFIERREHDRLGMVVFAGTALTQCPLTSDHRILEQLVQSVDFDTVPRDGTAIGMALATSLNRLRESKAKSRVIVLLTDGINNAGPVDPETAAEMAKTLGVKIYSVGVGTRGPVPFPVQTSRGVDYVPQEFPLDEQGLARVAELTGGYYFRATDASSLEEAFRRIDSLEKSELEVRSFSDYAESFSGLALGALVLVGLEVLLGASWLRKLP